MQAVQHAKQKLMVGFGRLINAFLLNPFNLVLSYKIGNDPLDDLKRLLNNNMLYYVVDGGAYRGDFSLEVANHFPSASIYAFEPQKDSYSLLSNNVASQHNIKPINCALGENSGEAILYQNISPMTNSLSQSTDDALKYFKGYNDPVGQEKVDVIALADFMNKEGIQYLDLLKLDLQGYELKALLGLRDLIGQVKSVYIEVEFIRLYETAPLFSEIDCFLRERGFIFFQFYGLVRSPDNGRLLYGDALFLNTRLISL